MHCTIYKKRIALNQGSKFKTMKGLDNLVKRTVVLTATYGSHTTHIKTLHLHISVVEVYD